MSKTRVASLALVLASVLAVAVGHAQDAPASGVYQIVSGHYGSCCGFTGQPQTEAIPNRFQGLIELIIDRQQNVAQMTFLSPDASKVFQKPPDGPQSGFTFMWTNGLVFPDHIQFGQPLTQPDQVESYYVVSNAAGTLQIQGAVHLPCPGCVDFPTEFWHLGVLAVAAPRLSPPVMVTSNLVRLRIFGGFWGQTNIVEASSDLANWTPVRTNAFPTTACPSCSFIDFEEGTTNPPVRFYRAHNLPMMQ